MLSSHSVKSGAPEMLKNERIVASNSSTESLPTEHFPTMPDISSLLEEDVPFHNPLYGKNKRINVINKDSSTLNTPLVQMNSTSPFINQAMNLTPQNTKRLELSNELGSSNMVRNNQTPANYAF